MAWIESHQELARHPKTLRAAKLLRVSVPTLIGHLHLLWWWALDYAPDGDLGDLSPTEIAKATLWDGHPSKLVQALRDCGTATGPGFLEIVHDRLLIHDWELYGAKQLRRRQEQAQRMRERRRVARLRVGAAEDILARARGGR